MRTYFIFKTDIVDLDDDDDDDDNIYEFGSRLFTSYKF